MTTSITTEFSTLEESTTVLPTSVHEDSTTALPSSVEDQLTPLPSSDSSPLATTSTNEQTTTPNNRQDSTTRAALDNRTTPEELTTSTATWTTSSGSTTTQRFKYDAIVSSTFNHGMPSLVIDGDHKSCLLMGYECSPWIKIDLGSNILVSGVKFYGEINIML